ncbi:MAG: ATP-dependent RNA helicase HrpA [Betaproteobacteria bacterium]|nr:ATP-dependent RNA helicase HrpA [Betaproteobacteria bacterium]
MPAIRSPLAVAASPAIRRRLLAALDGVMLADRRPLQKRIERWAARPVERDLAAIEAALERSQARVAQRRLGVPAPNFPEELPVSALRGEIAAAISAHQVVIVCGETGSGKTTQLPKICMTLGRGVRGLIGHTQPRRIAARTVANRIAQELGTRLGDVVGFQVRFTGEVSERNYVKLMTDGILLAETQNDRFLSAYDTIIIDEAHERSLNIDFLLGYLKQLLPRRPDLKVIVTSATLDAERFSRHFGQNGAPAPVIEVSGRMYPVEVLYRPLAKEEDDDEAELEDAIVDAVDECVRHGPGDVLVFLPGEREIRETADLLRRHAAQRRLPLEILPLYARLSVNEQQRVFETGGALRRVVLATNVAETSLTVPGIRYVIDPGLARINRYSVKNKVQLLQIEKISQAAANQRAGRCGRIAAGVCVRLYSEEDFGKRPAYTDPEILRSSLAAVILRMASLRIGEVSEFPFLEAPTPRAVADGYLLLQELDAVTSGRELTALGRELAKLPLDPRVGRMILAGRDEGVLAEVLIIAAALSVPDPRERPLERQSAADQAHHRFKDDRSDFLSFIHLWDFFTDALALGLSHRKLVDHCRAHFVSTLRVREWRDIHSQLTEILREAGWNVPALAPARERPKDGARAGPAKAAADVRFEKIHRALLTGLLGNIGCRTEEDESYQGARGIRFHLHPGSGINRKGAKWVMVGELAETTRLYGRCAARIELEWIERVAGGRCERTYFEPHWDKARGEVVASERVALYGLTLVPRRRVSFGAIDPALAREIFLREGLAPGEHGIAAPFAEHNRKLLAEIAELEHKARRQDVLVDAEDVVAFFGAIVPPDVSTRAGFEHWRQDAEKKSPRLLFLTREDLMRHHATQVTEEQFPETMQVAGNALPLAYRFEPGHPADGITLTVPLALLNQVDESRLDWLVPGMVREKVQWLLKALPKALRNRETPLTAVVTDFLVACDRSPQAPGPALREFLGARWKMPIPADVWDGAQPPSHLLVNVRVVDAAGKELATGRDLRALKNQLGEAAQLTFSASDPGIERAGLKAWDCGDLPAALSFIRDGRRLTGYPALVDEGDTVAVRLLDTADASERAHRLGVLRLLRIALKEQLRQLEKGWPNFNAVALQLRTRIAPDRLLADWMDAVCDRAFLGDDPLPRDAARFEAQKQRARTRLAAVREGAQRLLTEIAAAHAQLSAALAQAPGPLQKKARALETHRDRLVFPGFMQELGWDHLAHLPRYLNGIARRFQKYPENPDRDGRNGAIIDAWHQRWMEQVGRAAKAGPVPAGLRDFRWWIEELAVALFAQELKTPFPVSHKRLEKRWSDLTR